MPGTRVLSFDTLTETLNDNPKNRTDREPVRFLKFGLLARDLAEALLQLLILCLRNRSVGTLKCDSKQVGSLKKKMRLYV